MGIGSQGADGCIAAAWRGKEEKEIMGPGVGAVLVLVAACLASAPSCTSASSLKFDLTIVEPNLVNSSGGSFPASSQFAFDPSKSKRLSWHNTT